MPVVFPYFVMNGGTIIKSHLNSRELFGSTDSSEVDDSSSSESEMELTHLGWFVSLMGTVGMNRSIELLIAVLMYYQMNSVLFDDRAKVKSYS